MGLAMRLDQEVRHTSEDIQDDVLLDGVKALKRRVRVINREYDIPYMRDTARTDIPCLLTGTCRAVSASC
jgi:hypothetical protein